MIYSYKMESKSATALSAALGKKKIKHDNSKFKGGPNKLVINWGSKNLPDEVMKCQVVNHPKAVEKASNKKTFFEIASGIKDLNIPEFTNDVDLARQWCQEGSIIVVRELLTGHSGKGISLLESEVEFNKYPHQKSKLFVRYIPKKQEFRVHVLGGQILDVRRKALSPNIDPKYHHVDWKIRNHKGGFIYVKTEPSDYNEQVTDQAVKAIDAVGLDFGAVDVIWNEHRQKAYVLEINTAPGLEGSSIDNYKKGFETLYNELPHWLKEGKPMKPKFAKYALDKVAVHHYDDIWGEPQQNVAVQVDHIADDFDNLTANFEEIDEAVNNVEN